MFEISMILGGSQKVTGSVTADKTVLYPGDTITYTLHATGANNKTVYWKILNTGNYTVSPSTLSGSVVASATGVATITRTIVWNKSYTGTIRIAFASSQADLNAGTYFAQSSIITLTASPTGSTSWTTPGTRNFTVPAGVYRITQVLKAGSGGGGGASGTGAFRRGNGGAGGYGGYLSSVLTVVPGRVLPVTTGVAGTAGIVQSTSGTNGGDGGDTTVNNNGTISTTTGGKGGEGHSGQNTAGGAAGANGTPYNAANSNPGGTGGTYSPGVAATAGIAGSVGFSW